MIDRIAHAVAYVKVFMGSGTIDDSTLEHIRDCANILSIDNVVLIIKESAQRSNLYGSEIVVREMDRPEFRDYIEQSFVTEVLYAV